MAIFKFWTKAGMRPSTTLQRRRYETELKFAGDLLVT